MSSAAIFGISAGLQAAGSIRANREEAKAQFENAAFFEDQARSAELMGKRQARLFREEVDEFKAAQTGAFTKAGVDFSGSALVKLNQTEMRAADEMQAIRRDTEFRAKLARMKGAAAIKRGKFLSRPENALLTAITAAAPGAAQAARSADTTPASATQAQAPSRRVGERSSRDLLTGDNFDDLIPGGRRA